MTSSHTFALPEGTVFLAEKPSVARDIAAALDGTAKQESGYIRMSTGVIIVAARGHLITQGMPHDYNAELKRWSWDTLPIMPEGKWIHKIVPDAERQVRVIGEALRNARLLIIATDAGREGELIARELIEWHNYRGPVKRLWLQAMTKTDIQRGLANLRNGTETEPLYAAAKARAEADWLYGINGSRATSLGIKHYKQVYPLGRVQTPTLYLIVAREAAVTGFTPEPYYEIAIEVQTASGATLRLLHAPEDEHRIRSKEEAAKLLEQAQSAQGPLSVINTHEKERPPMPHTLASLQQEANKFLSLSAQQTLDTAQALYEKHKALSYPRTGCPYLAESLKAEVEQSLDWIAKLQPAAVQTLRSSGVVLRDSVFNDSKLEDHHGIIPKDPTRLMAEGSLLEKQVYILAATRFLRALSKDCLFDKTVIQMDANGVPFSTSGKTITQPGWRGVKATMPS